MSVFADGPVRVTVPATSANLGPGFDSLGLALGMRDSLVGEVTGSGLEVEVDGVCADDVPRDESHLVVRAMRSAFAAMDASPPGLRLSCDNAIPHGRGLGSSAAAIVGGAALARALVSDGTSRLDDDALLRLAAGIEGHPDNVGPALHGGFVISGRQGADFFAVPATVDPRISVVVFVPPEPVSTELARDLLPEQVPHADAAADAGRTALLVAALAERPEHLFLATRDFLHQEFRRTAMPESLALVDKLREDGVAATVSGAGPTVLAFIAGQRPEEDLLDRCPPSWECHHLEIDRLGVQVG
jgi:homoserine kinase